MLFLFRIFLIITGKLRYKNDKTLILYGGYVVFIKKLNRSDFYHPKTLVDEHSVDTALMLMDSFCKNSMLKNSIFIFPKDGFLARSFVYGKCFNEIDEEGSFIVKIKLLNEFALKNKVFTVIIKKTLA